MHHVHMLLLCFSPNELLFFMKRCNQCLVSFSTFVIFGNYQDFVSLLYMYFSPECELKRFFQGHCLLMYVDTFFMSVWADPNMFVSWLEPWRVTYLLDLKLRCVLSKLLQKIFLLPWVHDLKSVYVEWWKMNWELF